MKTNNSITSSGSPLKHRALALALGLGLAAGTALAVPANDDFANAIDLTGAGVGQTGSVTTGDQTGTNTIDATVETGEPAISGATKTVWFKWTSPGDGEFTFGTLGSTNAGATEWDSMIGIYTGATVDALTPLGETPKDTVVPETMTIPVTLGTTYYIQLAGYLDVEAANILLTWNAVVNQADILTFGPGATIGTVVANAADIDWTVFFGSDLSTLAPTFTLSPGATCTVDGNPVSSGDTIDFSGGPKDYVVTSQDASVVNTHTVTVTVGPPSTDGTWTNAAGGNWSDTANWLDGIVANGEGATADFTLDLGATATVTLDTSRTIGNVIKDDTSSDNNILAIAGSETLTLEVTSGSPVITNSDAGSVARFEIGVPIASGDGLTKDGPGYVLLNNTSSSWTGDTIISAGMLQIGSIPSANIGGGSGRNITLADGAAIQRTWTIFNNDFLNRLVETTDTIGLLFSATGPSYNTNDLDFSSGGAGADLPNAFLGVYATNGAKSQYDGIITPASDNYRWGHPLQSGSLHIQQAHGDVGGTPRGLIIGGGAVIIAGDNTFTGDTVIQGGRLFLGRQLCLQNSALNVGNGSGDGITGSICFLASNGGGVANAELTDEPTLGGLIGARNLASIYSSANQNNTTRLAIGSVLGLTLDVDSGKTHAYAGNARLAAGMYLTKTGLGTQVLSGANDYTGATTVSQGTLALVGGSQASPITVASGASLDFTLGSTTTSSSSVDLTDGTVKITGAVDNSSDYQLMTAALGFTGTPALDSPITNYALQLQNDDTELWLVFTGGAAGYTLWSGGAAPEIDTNGDGVSNGVAWALGAADPGENAIGLLPTLDNTSDTTYLIFEFNRSDLANDDPNTSITVQYGNDLVGWTTAVDDGDNVIITETPGTPTDSVEVKLKRSTIGAGGKLFARLNVVVTP